MLRRILRRGFSSGRPKWNPESVGLPKDFILTNFTKMKG